MGKHSVSSSPGARAHALPSLPGYDLLGLVAHGGMASVYRARSRLSGQVCALKWLATDHGPHGALLRASLEREYRTLRGLGHPRIIRALDYGVANGGVYYTMELLEGDDLTRTVPLPWRVACQYLRDIASCLSLLHARRLIHRDLSPRNVRLTGDGHCKLIDFGTLMDFGYAERVIGTPPFMAPEVLSAGHLDQRVDLFALGALGYYCLTGTQAYPAQHIDELPALWGRAPPSPSERDAAIPAALSALVMALLREDPLARPSSASEVIARLDLIGGLPAEEEHAERTLMHSYLVAPRYVGRVAELARAESALRDTVGGEGRALSVVARPGSGRTRFLEELSVRAQLAGCSVVRADGSAQHGPHALARALAHGLFDAAPDAARAAGRDHRDALAALDAALAARIGDRPASEPEPTLRGARRDILGPQHYTSQVRSSEPARLAEANPGIAPWLVAVSERRPIALFIDNADDADDASLGALLGLARQIGKHSVFLVLVDQGRPAEACPVGLALMRPVCERVALAPLDRAELSALLGWLFGSAPHAERLAEWIHEQTAGSPLHAMGVVRELIDAGVIRHRKGEWLLPDSRPAKLVASPLDDALGRLVAALSQGARELVEALGLARVELTVEICRRLAAGADDWEAQLDELLARNVLTRTRDALSFASAAMRGAIVARMDATSRRIAHRRLGQVLEQLAPGENVPLRIEAGFHLIRGGDELRGADLIAAAASAPLACAVSFAQLFRMGAAGEAALKVYRHARKSRRERLPLLTLLSQAGYYEHYRFALTYGDEALDAAEDLSGFALARRLAPYLGNWLGLLIGLGVAFAAHLLARGSAGRGSFHGVLVHLTSVVTTLCGVSVIALDAERCDRLAAVMSPAATLPRRATFAGIFQFCRALQHVARERQAEAYAELDTLAKRFADPSYYRLLPAEAHVTYSLGCQFGRGAFAMLRAEGSAALESAAALEASGLPLYMMIGSQLRHLYHLNRGELAQSRHHREAVELHAARVGSAWQVELWEPVATLPFVIAADDIVEVTRIADRLAVIAVEVPSLQRYAELAQMACELDRPGSRVLARLDAVLVHAAPRSFIGWSTAIGGAAVRLNRQGEHAQALERLRTAKALLTDADRAYVMLTLLVDVQTALAEAALGEPERALHELERVLGLYAHSEHPLALGLLHETLARIAHDAGLHAQAAEHGDRAISVLRATGTPLLVARADALARHLAGDPAPFTSRAPEA